MESIEQLSLFQTGNPSNWDAGWLAKQQPQNPVSKKRGRIARDATYAKFYGEGIALNENPRGGAEEKRSLLTKYFPARFGDNGKQPLKKTPDYQIRSLFERVMQYAKTRNN